MCTMYVVGNFLKARMCVQGGTSCIQSKSIKSVALISAVFITTSPTSTHYWQPANTKVTLNSLIKRQGICLYSTLASEMLKAWYLQLCNLSLKLLQQCISRTCMAIFPCVLMLLFWCCWSQGHAPAKLYIITMAGSQEKQLPMA